MGDTPLPVRSPMPGGTALLRVAGTPLAAWASGTLCALLTAAHGAPRTWLPCLGLR